MRKFDALQETAQHVRNEYDRAHRHCLDLWQTIDEMRGHATPDVMATLRKRANDENARASAYGDVLNKLFEVCPDLAITTHAAA